jgi:hypothetical protein
MLTILGEKLPPLVIVQHASRFERAESYGDLSRIRALKQGDNTLSYYERTSGLGTRCG